MLTNHQKVTEHYGQIRPANCLRLSGIAVHGLVRCSIKSNYSLVVFPLFYQREKPAAPSGSALNRNL